jgi:hypothetical protein
MQQVHPKTGHHCLLGRPSCRLGKLDNWLTLQAANATLTWIHSVKSFQCTIRGHIPYVVPAPPRVKKRIIACRRCGLKLRVEAIPELPRGIAVSENQSCHPPDTCNNAPLTTRVQIPAVAPRNVTVFVRRPGQQATRQPIGKFMKHGRQTLYYRKSVKAKVKPEEEN